MSACICRRMIIFLEWLLPVISSDLPKAGGPRQRFYSVLLRMGFTYASSVTRKAVVSYTALPPLHTWYAVYFCCTFLRVTSTGRYPASCPVKPGLSSSAAFRHLHPRTSVLLALDTLSHFFISVKDFFYTPGSTCNSFPSAAVVARVSQRSFCGCPSCPFTQLKFTWCGFFASRRRFHRSVFLTGSFFPRFQPFLIHPSIQC